MLASLSDPRIIVITTPALMDAAFLAMFIADFFIGWRRISRLERRVDELEAVISEDAETEEVPAS
jgi:hypothetical protein